MTVRDLLRVPHPVLRTRCPPVSGVDESVRALMDDLLDSLHHSEDGIGLAAPQIGVSRRVAVIDLHRGAQPDQILKMANPRIVWSSQERARHEEGCLSIPDYYAEIERPAQVKVAYEDAQGHTREIEAAGFLCVCLQHEIDHLDGVLFIDYLSRLKRDIVLRKLRKRKKMS